MKSKDRLTLDEILDEIGPEKVWQNLMKALTTCWKCNTPHALDAPVCEVCGNELMEYGKH